MQWAKENIVGPYSLKLNPIQRRGNQGIKGLDPYEQSDWSGGVNLLPNFQHPYIHNYMILSVSAYTHKVFTVVGATGA